MRRSRRDNGQRISIARALADDEGVFAYSRISPNSRFLAYASESRSIVSGTGRSQEIVVVDLIDGTEVFREPGIDAYWSPDGERMIYLSFADPENRVSVWHRSSGAITRNVAPPSLGDYYSWGEIDGHQRILTIRSHYYELDGDVGVLPAAQIPSCPVIGVGERPLISKDGRRATTFVDGTVVVRNLADCNDILDTGLPGAKADFSYDGRYIAFHAPNTSGFGYEIQVVDLQDRTVRTVTELPGSSFFPSWTADGRLSFRYDGEEYRGFVMAKDVLSASERPLPASAQAVVQPRRWGDVFPEAPLPRGATVVLVWGTWSAHAPMALHAFREAADLVGVAGSEVTLAMATDPGSREADIARFVKQAVIRVPRLSLDVTRFVASGAHNQNPTYILFRDGVLAERRLGALDAGELAEWVRNSR
jgi:WD40 repeat protein